MTATQTWDAALVQQIIESLANKPGALLPILHGIQNALGYIPPESVPMIARALQQSRAEVHGVITFYHHFRMTPPGSHVVQICRAEACQARGSRALETHVKESLNVDYHGTTADREITLEPVYCLGNCACGPNIRVGDQVLGRMDSERFDALVDELTHQPLEVK